MRVGDNCPIIFATANGITIPLRLTDYGPSIYTDDDNDGAPRLIDISPGAYAKLGALTDKTIVQIAWGV